MPDAHANKGPGPVCTLTAAYIEKLTDSYVVILATLGERRFRRVAARVWQARGLWLSARPERHARLVDEAMASHVHVQEAA